MFLKMKKAFVIVSFLLSLQLFSQENTTPQKMISEIQQIKQTGESMKLVWWIPTEYWQVALKEQKNITQQQTDYIKNLFNDYTIIIAGDFSLVQSNSDLDFMVNDVKKSFSLLNKDDQKIMPLKESEVDAQVTLLMNDVLKPLFVQMLGKMGSGVEIFIYNNKDKSGKRIIHPKESGTLKAKMGNSLFEWKLPLVSLMTDKICKEDSEIFPGNYVYCPFHGTKL